jgi:hypothetical protein
MACRQAAGKGRMIWNTVMWRLGPSYPTRLNDLHDCALKAPRAWT